MLFNSFDFVIFFPLVTILYFIVPHAYRWLLLLIASCYFYMLFVPYYILIIGAIIGIDYTAGLWIDKATEKAQKKKFLMMSIIANVGILFIFKYYNFFINVMDQAAIPGAAHLPYLSLLLPIGLSFHTFQAMSYTIEVYRGNFKAERHFGRYALYVMFYPQLVAGPIERPQRLLPQFYEKKTLNYTHVAAGLKMMLWGFFKKLVIADRLAVIVNQVYAIPKEYDALSLLFATYLFTFQIYCDFSGYSDIAIGASKVMGFDLTENFKTPFLSKSIMELWSRWHISLTNWFRDYVYIPLGGNRVKKWKRYANLLLVFLISGLWHGANVTFLVWGALQALFIIITLIIQKNSTSNIREKKRVINVFRVLVTFHLFAGAFIFFRANTINEAVVILTKIATIKDYAFCKMRILNDVRIEFICTSVFLLVIFLLADPFMDLVIKGKRKISTNAGFILFSLVLVFILIGGYFGKTKFIYFQF